MARNFGSLAVLDTLRAIDKDNIMDYGMDNLYADMSDLLEAHNVITADILNDFAETSTDEVDRYGGTLGKLGFQELDETGIASAQKTGVTGVDIGFPLRRFGRATQWTSLYWKTHSPADFAKEITQMLLDDVTNIENQLRRALFKSTNNLTYVDRLASKKTLPLRALLNADSAPIPPDRYGNTFDASTHTHYLATASLTASNVDSLIDTIVEHGVDAGESLNIYINRADEAAFAALSGFLYFERETIERGGGFTGDMLTTGNRQDLVPDNVAIGMWDGTATVWLKPWVPANYILASLVGGEGTKALRRRVPPWAGGGDLNLDYEHEHSPFTARQWERFLGVSVFTRHKAAVLYTGGGTYTIPTIAAP